MASKPKKSKTEVPRREMMLAISTIRSTFGNGLIEVRLDEGKGTLTMRSPAATACLGFDTAGAPGLPSPVVWEAYRLLALFDDPRTEKVLFVEEETKHVIRVGSRRASIAKRGEVDPAVDWAEPDSFGVQFSPVPERDVVRALKAMAAPILEQEHPTLQSVHLTAKDGLFVVEGTDNFRAFAMEWEEEPKGAPELDIVIPGRVANVVGRLGGDSLKISVGEKLVVFETSVHDMPMLVRAALIGEKYPNLKPVKSQVPEAWYVVKRKAFLDMIEAHEAIGRDKSAEGRFRFEPDTIRVVSGHGTPSVLQTKLEEESVVAVPKGAETKTVALRFGFVEDAVEFLCVPEGAQDIEIGFYGDRTVWFRQAEDDRSEGKTKLACIVAQAYVEDVEAGFDAAEGE